MKKAILLLGFLLCIANVDAQELKKAFKFATFYTALNGGNSIADQDVWSVTHGGLQNETVEA